MSAFTTHSYIERLEEEVLSLKADNESLKQRVVAMTNQLTGNRKNNKKVLEQRDVEINTLNMQLYDESYKYDRLYEEHSKTCELLKKKNEEYQNLKESLHDVIDAREDEIYELKKELEYSKGALEAMRQNWNIAKAYTDDVIHQRDTEIAQLKKELADQHEFTEKAIAHASEVEGELVIKNTELTARLNMLLTELYERQSDTIYDMDCNIKKNNEMINAENENILLKAELKKYKEALAALNTAHTYMTSVFSAVM